MSLFTDQGEKETTSSWIDRVAADKGDTFRDPEQLAKSLFHANMHSKTLEDENRELREKAGANSKFEELIAELRKGAPTGGDNTQKITSGEDGNNRADPEDIKKLVEEAVTAREQSRTKEQNIADVRTKLTEAYGTEAEKEVKKRAGELGMSVEQLGKIAEESPTAFLRLIGEGPTRKDNSTVDSSVNTANFTHSNGKRNWNYYKALRRENPKLYRSPQVQRQMEADYAEQGSDYWKA